MDEKGEVVFSTERSGIKIKLIFDNNGEYTLQAIAKENDYTVEDIKNLLARIACELVGIHA